MYKNCEWLPELIKLDTEIDDEIIEILYNIFSTDIYGTTLYYKGKEVRFRREPMWKGKEEGFFFYVIYPTPRSFITSSHSGIGPPGITLMNCTFMSRVYTRL